MKGRIIKSEIRKPKQIRTEKEQMFKTHRGGVWSIGISVFEFVWDLVFRIWALGERVVSTRAVPALIAIICLTAGCGARTGTIIDEAEVESLPILTPKSGGEMALIPGGNFIIRQWSDRHDETLHGASVSAFYLDNFPMTQELYEKVMGVNPSKRKAKDNPV